MNVWTRTLNLDDAHTLLALAEPGLGYEEWAARCDAALPALSPQRRRELVRLIGGDFLSWTGDARVAHAAFLDAYSDAPAMAQLDLVQVQWALTHPLTLLAVEALVAPALRTGALDIPLDAVDALVAERVDSDSPESLRKTRTVLLGALEGVGAITTRGTGQHRSLQAARGRPHPVAFGYLIRRDLEEHGHDAMPFDAALAALPERLTCCGVEHARTCLSWCFAHEVLFHRDGEVAA